MCVDVTIFQRNAHFSASQVYISRIRILPNGSINDVRKHHVQPRLSNRLRICIRDVFSVKYISLMKLCDSNIHVKFILPNFLCV
jgi:hypothetical protein